MPNLFARVYPLFPADWLAVLTPYRGAPHFGWRLPDRFAEWVIDHLFVVAIPEEFFYRGYLQRRLRDAWPAGRLFLEPDWAARSGRRPCSSRSGISPSSRCGALASSFRPLIFGWMRERSRSVVGGALFHAASNLLVQVLDACFFG